MRFKSFLLSHTALWYIWYKWPDLVFSEQARWDKKREPYETLMGYDFSSLRHHEHLVGFHSNTQHINR